MEEIILDTYLLEEMTWPEIEEALESGMKTVIIYAASIEQHGPHLAELTDTALGYAQATDLAKRLGNALVAPVIRPGLSEHHMAMPGSITLRPEVFTGLVEDYVSAYVKHGFDTIILSSSHGGNFEAIEKIAENEAKKYPNVKIISGYGLKDLPAALTGMERAEGLEAGACGGHACDYETSVMLMLDPKQVRMEKAEKGFMGLPSKELIIRMMHEGIPAISKIGVMGDPTDANAERGARYFKAAQDLQEKIVRAKLASYKV